MTVWADLAADEQSTLLDAIHGASVVVSVASPGRKEETTSEGFEAAAYILDSRDAQVANRLISSILVMFDEGVREGRTFPDYLKLVAEPDAHDRSIAALRAAAAIVDAKVDADEALGFKRWLLGIATATAEAGKEDQGFLGRGGVYVNDKERAALDEISAALGLEG
ncbi:MAG: hypothetical protein U0869_14065 [Chloroflexota bacterium]